MSSVLTSNRCRLCLHPLSVHFVTYNGEMRGCAHREKGTEPCPDSTQSCCCSGFSD